MTPKQQRFVSEYLVDLNATQAAIRAGYKETTAGQIGHNLLGKSEIQDAIRQAKDERAARTELNQDYVIEKLKEIADKEAYDYNDSSLKVSSKLKALELLGKHLGLFTEKIAIAAIDPETVKEVERIIHDAEAGR